MKKFIKRLMSTFMSIVIVLTMTTNAFASDNILKNHRSQQLGKKVSFSELPVDYQKLINPDSIIYQQKDGSYDIFQNEPILEPQISPLAMDRYAPNGGSYSNLEKAAITNLTYVVYQTYLPRDRVNEWIADQVPGMRSYIVGLVAELGITKASTIATKVLTKYGINISVTAIVTIAQGAYFTLNWLNYQQVKSASNSGKNGILIEYLTTIGSGNARVYSQWIGTYVPMYPRGGNATWHEANYYVMP